MKRALFLAVAANLVWVAWANGTEIVWTESFENGVGRLNQTVGNGESRYAWDSSNQAIDATYFRASQSDMRLAGLGGSFNLANAVVGFDAIVRPYFGDGQSVGALGRIGFGNPVDGVGRNNLALGFNHANSGTFFKLKGFDDVGAELKGDISLPYAMGSTYYMEAFSVLGDFRVDIWLGTDSTGSHLGTITRNFSDREIYVDSLGLFNIAAGGGDRTLKATVYEIAYTIPEPSTALLLTAASLFAVRHRRHGNPIR